MSGHRLLNDLYLDGTPHVIPDPGDEGTFVVDRQLAVCEVVTGASEETRTLGNPKQAGQVLTIVMKTDGGGDCVITVTDGADMAGHTTVTLADAADFVTFMSTRTGTSLRWRVLGMDGPTGLTPVARADLVEDALQSYPVYLDRVRQDDYTALAITETADTFNLNISSDLVIIQGETAQGATETSVGYFQFQLPPEYVAGGDVQLCVAAAYSGSGTVGATKTIDFNVYEINKTTGAKTADGDICATAAQALSTTEAVKTFTITSTNLAPGDLLTAKMTTALQETGGSNALTAHINSIYFNLDVKG